MMATCSERARIARKKQRDELNRLVESAKNLREIVEGVRSVRWAFNGSRFKDTTEWAEFYSALANFKL